MPWSLQDVGIVNVNYPWFSCSCMWNIWSLWSCGLDTMWSGMLYRQVTGAGFLYLHVYVGHFQHGGGRIGLVWNHMAIILVWRNLVYRGGHDWYSWHCPFSYCDADSPFPNRPPHQFVCSCPQSTWEWRMIQCLKVYGSYSLIHWTLSRIQSCSSKEKAPHSAWNITLKIHVWNLYAWHSTVLLTFIEPFDM